MRIALQFHSLEVSMGRVRRIKSVVGDYQCLVSNFNVFVDCFEQKSCQTCRFIHTENSRLREVIKQLQTYNQQLQQRAEALQKPVCELSEPLPSSQLKQLLKGDTSHCIWLMDNDLAFQHLWGEFENTYFKKISSKSFQHVEYFKYWWMTCQ